MSPVDNLSRVLGVDTEDTTGLCHQVWYSVVHDRLSTGNTTPIGWGFIQDNVFASHNYFVLVDMCILTDTYASQSS